MEWINRICVCLWIAVQVKEPLSDLTLDTGQAAGWRWPIKTLFYHSHAEVDANIWAANHVVEPERRVSWTSRRFYGYFVDIVPCRRSVWMSHRSPNIVCSGLCYYRRLPHWLSRSDAFCSGEPGSMKGQLAGCRTGRHVLSVASLERFHSKSRPLPTDTIKVNSNAKNMAAVFFFLFNLE